MFDSLFSFTFPAHILSFLSQKFFLSCGSALLPAASLEAAGLQYYTIVRFILFITYENPLPVCAQYCTSSLFSSCFQVMSDRDVIDLNSVETLFRSDSSNPQLANLLSKYSVLSVERCSTNRYTKERKHILIYCSKIRNQVLSSFFRT